MLLFVLTFLQTILGHPIFAQTPATSAATVTIPTISITSSSSATPAPSNTPTPNPAIALYNQYKNDYLFNRDQYAQSYLDYTQKKQIYTKYNTVTTQNDKIDATKQALITRNNTLKTYLRALRVKLDIYKTSDPTNTNKLQIELSKLENYFDEQNTIVTTLNNDADIQNNATDFRIQYIHVQQIEAASLVQSEYNLRLSTLNELKSYITQLQTDSTLTTEGKQSLSNEIIKADNALTNLNNAQDIVNQNMGPSTYQFSDFYPDAKAKLVTANQYEIDIINDLQNILVRYSNSQ